MANFDKNRKSIGHPMLDNFRRALETGHVSIETAAKFDEWRQKLDATSDLRRQADDLWRKYGGVVDSRPSRGGMDRTPTPVAGDNVDAASADCLDAEFHNPYTFIPFRVTAPERKAPTPLSIDEVEKERLSGVLDLELTTLSPLLTCSPQASNVRDGHRTHPVLAIGKDVIVPATGVRGMLRSLLAMLTGGTLGYVDEEAWLTQGRDLPLGPTATQGNVRATLPALAEVVEPGGPGRAGKVLTGETRLVTARTLEDALGRELPRPRQGKATQRLWANGDGTSVVDESDDEHRYRVRLSGRPIKPDGKKEGLLRTEGDPITLPAQLWVEYRGRHRHSEHSELKKGDLVWLELANPGAGRPRQGSDVASIQWARWGRRGIRLLDLVKDKHPQILPDCANPDGKVDSVTDLFGQIPNPDLADSIEPGWRERKLGPAGPFAARVRPQNLVFRDAKAKVRATTLAPLAPPHPGCAAFYREQTDPDLVANDENTGLRGYKVYRTSGESGDVAPWNYSVQGVYDEQGLPKPAGQKTNKTCDLLPANLTGRLRIACRALTARELALLVAACSVDWRLGGGKPLGLGHCRITSATWIDENGERREIFQRKSTNASIPADDASLLKDLRRELTNRDWSHVEERMRLYQATQVQVPRLRYPRAVEANRKGIARGGHVWFGRHASPRKGTRRDSQRPVGLQVTYVAGDLRQKAGKEKIRAQVLPAFRQGVPKADVLHGFDLNWVADGDGGPGGRGPKRFTSAEPFDPSKHQNRGERSAQSQSPNRSDRRAQRKDRDR